ncbi:MAG: hypothetical protein H6711_18445 [Myxococcales bacterium]|nr:hypothetical protein [Myxococcales bacterium]
MSSEAPASARGGARVAAGRGFIAGPIYDGLCFIGSPALAMILGFAIAGSPLRTTNVSLWGHAGTPASIFIGAFIMAHLGLVFFRSHANASIFRLYPLRFTLAPIALFVGICLSNWVMVCTSVIATWWDVYHSSLQTFGIGRIYDMKAGNGPQVGRRLDYLLNILLYAGPILAGATLFDHVNDFDEFETVDAAFFTAIPAQVEGITSYLTWAVIGIGVPFLAYYVASYLRFARQGYRVSPQKVALLVNTGLCSIFVWGFNPFGEAFFIMNFFHALQYFALVWWIERDNLTRVMHTRWRGLTLALFLGLAAAYGLWAEVLDAGDLPDPGEVSVGEAILGRWGIAVVSVVSIMHFWYDGFIWSVRKKQV